MSMLRKSSLNQLKRINDEIKKQGGITDRTIDSEKGLPNVLWIHNPIDADKSGKRKIITYEQMFNIDIPDNDVNEKMRYKNMKNIMSFEKMFENESEINEKNKIETDCDLQYKGYYNESNKLFDILNIEDCTVKQKAIDDIKNTSKEKFELIIDILKTKNKKSKYSNFKYYLTKNISDLLLIKNKWNKIKLNDVKNSNAK